MLGIRHLNSWNLLLEAKVSRLLSNQRHLKALPAHGYDILVAFLLFTVASWFSYYFVAPVLVHYSRKRMVKDDELARIKWGHMLVSFLHAIIVSFWSLYLWYDNTLADSVEKRVLGYSKPFGYMFSFSVGYFIWDFMCCIWFRRYYGKGFLIHALLGLAGLTCCYRPFMMYPTSRFLLFEVSTIFIDMHWFLEKLGYGGTIWIMINDGIALLAYLGVRLIFGSYLTFKFVRDLRAMWYSVPLIYSVLSLVGNLTTHALNFYWFYKLLRAAYRSIFLGGKNPSKSAMISDGVSNNAVGPQSPKHALKNHSVGHKSKRS
jgi:hypothetical protein